jgi:hypothetical protein
MSEAAVRGLTCASAGALGFVLAIPLVRRLRRRTGSWAIPGGVLGLMA